ncbi:MAG: hydrolase 76 protein [Claussenomyces sp. TS43310]|nr:MAG: hydrolase 76 protein [Claussenomyces sp. TS43310]
MRFTSSAGWLALFGVWRQLAGALELNVNDIGSIKNATSVVAYGLMKYYSGNVTDTASTIAVLPEPYYWWEAGAMWGGMLDYYKYTNDSTYLDNTLQALLSQVGPNYDFMVPAQQFDEGNDDQGFWGFAIMSAAEHNITAPPSPTPSWLQLTINLWNSQVARWETTTCNGGLRWQIFSSNSGYTYKNSVSNGAFFQLSARLARFTGNQTYVEWAQKVWDWETSVGLIDGNYKVYDGGDMSDNCTSLNHIQWTYGVAIHLYGAAVMYNYTNASALWQERTEGMLNASAGFFSPFSNATDVMYEAACETVYTCNVDQFSFKAYLGRFMWKSTKMAAFTYGTVAKYLEQSSKAAARSCSGGTDGVTCGTRWYINGWDGSWGAGQQLSALEVMQGLLVNLTAPPMTEAQVHMPATVSTSAISSQSTSSTRPDTRAISSTRATNAAGASAPTTVAAAMLGAVFVVGAQNI